MKDNFGFVLMTAIIILVLFTTLGVVGVSLFSTDTRIAMDTLSSTQALFLAEAAQQYTMEYLSNQPNWLIEVGSIPDMAGGTLSAQYVSPPGTNSVTIKFIGTKNNVTRKIEPNFTKDFYIPGYGVIVGGSVKEPQPPGLTINGGQLKEGATEFPNVAYAYYESIADHKVEGNQTFTAGTYSGLWYVNGNVDFNSDVTLNGSVISTGNIDMHDRDNITVTASTYPALVSCGNFLFQDSTDVNITGFVFVGSDLEGNFLSQKAQITINGVIMVAGNFNNQNGNIVVNYNGGVSGTGLKGAPNQNTWREVN